MIQAPKIVVSYTVEERADEEAAFIADEPLPPPLLDYLRERRRAIITELRKIEDMLDMPQSIPARKRPH